jgi:hypothetical protein
MYWLIEARRWLYLNLVVLAGFAIIGSLARPTVVAQSGPPPSLVCGKTGCDQKGCSGCLDPGAVCTGPPPGSCCHCTPKPYPVGCVCTN